MRPLHAVVLPPGPRFLDVLTAALDGTGPALLPVAPGTPEPALRALVETAKPAALVDSSGVHALEGGVPTDAAVLIATSGSTGRPKVVELTAGALESSARSTLSRVGARHAPWLCCLPTSHIAGVQVLVRALLGGVSPVIHPGFDLMEVAKAGEVHISLVPTQLRRLLDVEADLSSYASILLGGAAAPSALLAEARDRGARIFTTYGMSETSGGCVYDGVPLEGVEVSLDAAGRISLSGSVLFSGYRFAERRPGRWFTTQDLGVFEEGRLRVLGRIDDVINTGGEKVVAGAVAEIVSRHPRVREAVVVGRDDPEWGSRVTAVVVADGPVTLDELRDLVRAELPAHAAPRELEIRAELPLLASGKPDREALRRAPEAGTAGTAGLTGG
ncbi:O-succinylbenzoic acid--CoA ligase [Actinocorallia herbida]|uniref:O-succinylbenzoic acid--CoA ligase n=1 Tax=Actinocorallia herbida TaxID=58109 RepID=A0A3N1CTU6_9ACTN|nr:AMP-binding protein [Actinocorallia herbida]ROO84645.1 O-succinylbenzoic acid--CoA ligase [Actinocorallia herbida]